MSNSCVSIAFLVSRYCLECFVFLNVVLSKLSLKKNKQKQNKNHRIILRMGSLRVSSISVVSACKNKQILHLKPSCQGSSEPQKGF